MSKTREKILVAISGGVDSSVSAALLLEGGYDVIGVIMKNWTGCEWESDKRDALRVSAELGIKLHIVDFEKEYRERVYEYMVREYAKGRTPNPDVLCNSEIKFDLLLKVADDLNCKKMATGHYARVEEQNGIFKLKKGLDSNKDQSYFLCRLGQDELKRAVFPIGEIEKPKVREIAKKYNLITAEKKDSQGLCFVGHINLPTFLKDRIKPKMGDIINTEGEKLGKHNGVEYYTIGQRKGIGIGGTEPYYVVERNLKTNELIVGHKDDPRLFSKEIAIKDIQWTSGTARELPLKCNAKIRYRQKDQECTIINGNKVVFEQEQQSVAPGQFIVFYDGDELIASAEIK